MTSATTTCMLAARLACRSIRKRPVRRCFGSSSQCQAAQNFVMPAMSPTMTEGNIASWKVKEGDSFTTGDVLLEIETDKAQMDVEAQDDGIMAKITQPDGAKGVKVGTRIAVLAAPDDDIDTLDIPAEDSSTASKSSQQKESLPENMAKSQTESSPSPTPDTEENGKSSSSSSPNPSKPASKSNKQPYLPSVEHLLREKGISREDASKISASGPNGRLLKGDVLAHLGRIGKAYPSDQAKRLAKLGHLDLSNIKKAQPRKKAPPEQADAKSASQALLAAETHVAVPVSLSAVLATQKRIQESLGLSLPLSTFIARASEIANEDLPRGMSTPPSSDELFDSVLGLDKVRISKGKYTPQITLLPVANTRPSSVKPASKSDIIDILIGSSSRKPSTKPIEGISASVMTSEGTNIFSVSARKGDEKRARVYLERVKTVLESEPGRCVL